MGSKVIWYCDRCKKEIPKHMEKVCELETLVLSTQRPEMKEYTLCPQCRNDVENLLKTNPNQ